MQELPIRLRCEASRIIWLTDDNVTFPHRSEIFSDVSTAGIDEKKSSHSDVSLHENARVIPMHLYLKGNTIDYHFIYLHLAYLKWDKG
uniref:Uncharacterized protein n=1 Tax=Romanomermis culicivorax TaxID=13658 RepID=A0A915KDS4_ROMCU